jgi:N-acetylneuraminate synthase/N,N'-diacetyllegionaminate synthase
VQIIAEIGVHHQGDVKQAERLLESAHEAGADAVKFQFFTEADLDYRKDGSWDKLNRYYLCELEHRHLRDKARKLGMKYGVSFFGTHGWEQWSSDIDFVKIPAPQSRDNAYLCELVQRTCRIPVYCSIYTGEREPFQAAQLDWNLMHCTPKYPTPWEELNLDLAGVWGGWSCHARPDEITTAAGIAYAAGARIFEFHFADEQVPLTSPDMEVSVSVEDLKYIRQCLESERIALGEQYP